MGFDLRVGTGLKKENRSQRLRLKGLCDLGLRWKLLSLFQSLKSFFLEQLLESLLDVFVYAFRLCVEEKLDVISKLMKTPFRKR